MLDLRAISDRLEIQDLLASYADAIDSRDFDALNDLFTDDAVIDYSAVGGPCGALPEIKRYLARAFALFKSIQHLTASTKFDIDGDTAKARSILFNPIVLEKDGRDEVMYVGLWYNDAFVRTATGWRFQSRREEHSYTDGMPDWFVPPPAA